MTPLFWICCVLGGAVYPGGRVLNLDFNHSQLHLLQEYGRKALQIPFLMRRFRSRRREKNSLRFALSLVVHWDPITTEGGVVLEPKRRRKRMASSAQMCKHLKRYKSQITSSQAWICNPKMLGFRLSWLQKESYIIKLKHLYTWTINYCTYRFRAFTPCVLGIWRHLPFQSCQRWLLWCIRVCAVCNIVHDLFNENKLFLLTYRFYF